MARVLRVLSKRWSLCIPVNKWKHLGHTTSIHNQAYLSFGKERTLALSFRFLSNDRETKRRGAPLSPCENPSSSETEIFDSMVRRLYLVLVTRYHWLNVSEEITILLLSRLSLTVHSRLFFCLQISGQSSWESSTVSFEILGTCWGYRRPLTGAGFHVQDAPVPFTRLAAWVATTGSNASTCRVSSARTAICAASILRPCTGTLGPSITIWS